MKNQEPQSEVLVEFLSEFASYLLSSGIAESEFRSAAQSAFVTAAIRSARLQNSRVNQSAIAAVTGLSRPQVRALLRNPLEPLGVVKGRINRILSGWRSDPDFTDRDGTPRKLSTGPGGGFAALSRKYGRDVSYRALLSEIQRMGYAKKVGSFVSICSDSKNQRLIDLTHLLSQGLTQIIKLTPHGIPSAVHVITGEAIYESPAGSAKVLLKRRLVQGTKAFAADIKAAGDAIASRRGRAKSKRGTLSTRVLVVTME